MLKISTFLLICSSLICILKVPFVVAQTAEKQDLIAVQVNYKDGEVTITSVEKRSGYLPDGKNEPTQGYQVVLLDKNGKDLAKRVFNFPTEITAPEIPGQPLSQSITLKEASTIVTLKDNPAVASLVVKDPEGKVVAQQALSLEKIIEEAKKAQKKDLVSIVLAYLPYIGAAIVVLVILIATLLIFRRSRPVSVGDTN